MGMDVEGGLRRALKILREKRAAAVLTFRRAEKNLMMALEREPKEVILACADQVYRTEQEYAFMCDGVRLVASFLQPDVLLTQEERDERLKILLGMNRGFYKLKDLYALEDTDSGDIEVLGTVESLKETKAGDYVKHWAQEKGTCQGALERVRRLFPPPRPRLPGQ
jgi:hypothetical protein